MTLTDVKKVLVDGIKGKLPSHKIYATEVREDFEKPAFFIKVIPVSIQNRLYYKDVSLTVEIKYYSKDETYEDLMDVSDQLTELFGLTLTVGDRVITIENTEGETTDEDGIQYLQFNFDINYQDGKEVLEATAVDGTTLVMLPDAASGYVEDAIQLMGELDLTEEQEG